MGADMARVRSRVHRDTRGARLQVVHEVEGALAGGLRRDAVKAGMRPLRLAGAMKVAEGLTTLEEVMRSTPAIT
jgi:type II secretory ATPase GspE/PulE/Tfp pilus assembly ATPase PilB-like protein